MVVVRFAYASHLTGLRDAIKDEFLRFLPAISMVWRGCLLFASVRHVVREQVRLELARPAFVTDVSTPPRSPRVRLLTLPQPTTLSTSPYLLSVHASAGPLAHTRLLVQSLCPRSSSCSVVSARRRRRRNIRMVRLASRSPARRPTDRAQDRAQRRPLPCARSDGRSLGWAAPRTRTSRPTRDRRCKAGRAQGRWGGPPPACPSTRQRTTTINTT